MFLAYRQIFKFRNFGIEMKVLFSLIFFDFCHGIVLEVLAKGT